MNESKSLNDAQALQLLMTLGVIYTRPAFSPLLGTGCVQFTDM